MIWVKALILVGLFALICVAVIGVGLLIDRWVNG